MIFTINRFYITCRLVLMLLRKYLNPTIFLISKGKYVYGRETLPIPECSMVNWLFDSGGIFLVLSDSQMFLDAFNLLTVFYKLDTAT